MNSSKIVSERIKVLEYYLRECDLVQSVRVQFEDELKKIKNN